MKAGGAEVGDGLEERGRKRASNRPVGGVRRADCPYLWDTPTGTLQDTAMAGGYPPRRQKSLSILFA